MCNRIEGASTLTVLGFRRSVPSHDLGQLIWSRKHEGYLIFYPEYGKDYHDEIPGDGVLALLRNLGSAKLPNQKWDQRVQECSSIIDDSDTIPIIGALRGPLSNLSREQLLWFSGSKGALDLPVCQEVRGGNRILTWPTEDEAKELRILLGNKPKERWLKTATANDLLEEILSSY